MKLFLGNYGRVGQLLRSWCILSCLCDHNHGGHISMSGIMLYLLHDVIDHVLIPSLLVFMSHVHASICYTNEWMKSFIKWTLAETVSQIVPINSHFPARISKINIEDSREWPGPGVTTRYSGTLAPSRAVSAERDGGRGQPIRGQCWGKVTNQRHGHTQCPALS